MKKAHRRLSSRYHTLPLFVTLIGWLAAVVYFFFAPGTVTLKELKPLLDGEPVKIEPAIDLGLHLGALAALILLGVWLLASPWWAQRKRTSNGKPDPSSSMRKATPLALSAQHSPDGLHRAWFWVLVLLAVAAAGMIRSPRLGHSFWNDEEVSYRKFIYGAHKIDNQGEATFAPISWKRTWFYNITGNNHVLQSLSSRLTLELFDAENDDGSTINEPLARAVPYLAGLLSILAIAILLWCAGAGFAAVLAAWLLALHPWHVRYSAEARGYSMMLLFAILMLIALFRASHRRTWAAWTVYGVCQLACLLSFPAALYLVMTINLGVFLRLAYQRDLTSLKSWSTVCVLGSAVFMQIMMPSLLKMLGWLDTPYELPQTWNRAYFFDLWTHISAGIPLNDGQQPRALAVDLDIWQRLGDIRYWMIVVILPALTVLGAIGAIIKYPLLRLPIASAIAAVLLVLIHVTFKPMVFHGWYLLYLLVPFCISVPMIAEMLWRWKKPAGVVAAMILLLGYAQLVIAPIQRQNDYPRHPIREAVQIVRGETPALSSVHRFTNTIAIGPGSGQLASYDPRTIAVKDVEAFSKVLEQSRSEVKPLWVYSINDDLLDTHQPEIAAALQDPAQFEETDYLYAAEGFWGIRIYRAMPPDATVTETVSPANPPS